MKKLLVTALLVAASLLVVGTTLTANATSKTTPCKTVKFKVTRQVWNAKHTKKITVDVYRLVKESLKQDGKVDVFYVKKQVYKTERICTAATSATTSTVPTTVAPVPTTTAPITAVAPTPPVPTTVAPTTTTPTVPPTTTTVPGQSSIITSTTLEPENPNYPNTCSVQCDNESVFSVDVFVASNNDAVTAGAGRIWFVFDAPSTDTDGGLDPYQFNQFTLETTENGQTSCPLQWLAGEPGSSGVWHALPSSVATDGIPACTMTDVVLNDGITGASYACTYPQQPFYGPPYSNALSPGPVAGPCGYFPESGGGTVTDLEPCLDGMGEPTDNCVSGDTVGDVIGTPLSWSVTAYFIGDGPDAPSFSIPQNFVVTPDPGSPA